MAPDPTVILSVAWNWEAVIIPVVLILPSVPIPPPEAVIVTAAPDIVDTSKFVEKSIVPAVPTTDPSCLIIIPEPDPTTPVNPDPSPVKVPLTLRLPPTVALVLIATLTAFKFKLFGLSILGVPEEPIKFNSVTPKLLSAIFDIF